MRNLASTLSIVTVATSLGACAGANLNQRHAGNREGGVRVEGDEIAIDARGEFLIVRRGDRLLVGETATRTLRAIAGVVRPLRVAFWEGPRHAGFFALTPDHHLVSYDLEARAVLWRVRAGDVTRATRLDVTPDGRRVILSGADVRLFDAASGAAAGRFEPARPIEDFDATPDSRRLIVTEREVWNHGRPTTAIHVLSATTGEKLCTAEVPNCADELIVGPEGQRAYLSPTSCRRDPVSIVDVTADCGFETNLPGFGPVALTPDGRIGVAFLDRDADDPGAPPRPAEVDRSDSRFHLMLFDTRTHELKTVPVGDHQPRYALTPDGKTLVVDGLVAFKGEDDKLVLDAQPVRLVDVASRELRVAGGPKVMLNAYVLGRDSRDVWLVHAPAFEIDKAEARPVGGQLFHLDVVAARIEPVRLPFAPSMLSALPGAGTLVLRDRRGIHLFDVAERRVTATFREL